MNEKLVHLTTELIARVKEIFLLDTVEMKPVDDDVLNCIYVITQLFCVRLMKELLQLMPPEVFLAIKEKLPMHYVQSYLNHQFHFSLQEVVEDRIKKR